jgi:hypothetical protein
MKFDRIKDWKFITHARNWYGRFERPISSLSLVGGFVFDALTLQRVDAFWDNVWVIAHLAIVGVCIILIHRNELVIGDEKDPAKMHFWFVNVMQFFFGGILSTYLVFYFRSGDILVEWPFILMLALAFWANESFKRAYIRLSFQIVLFYLSIFAFAIFLVPVIVHDIGPAVFLLSGIFSLAAMAGFLWVLARFARGKVGKNKNLIGAWIAVVFIAVNVLYFNNLIPPIPLSIKDSGVYHSIAKDVSGDYIVTSEEMSWWNFFTLYKDFHASTTDSVYVYSAVFSPPAFNMNIIHDWQYYDPTAKVWTDEEKIALSVTGGREEGFRTWSVKNGLAPGHWRVNVQTETGQTIGTVRFNIVPPSPDETLQTETKT